MAKEPSIKLDKGIPVPPGHHGKWKVLLMKMKVGDSFLIPEKSVGSLRGSASHLSRNVKHQQQWVVKRADDGYRCWRIK
jgi:hypothetical protein